MANRGSSTWIKVLVLAPFLLLLVPLWLFVSGHVVGFLWFRFHMPALPLLAWVDY